MAGCPARAEGAVEGEAELGGDDDLIADRRQGHADKRFVGERAVDLGGVEEGDAEADRVTDQGDAVLSRRRGRSRG